MLKIIDVETMVLETPENSFINKEVWDKYPVHTRFSGYDEFGKIMKIHSGVTPTAFCVKLTCENGLYGYGSTGGYVRSKDVIDRFFKPLLIGQDALEIEKLWDIMFNASMPWGRRGVAIMAISALDNALWDIFGKFTGLPVYQLLGGKVRDSIACYGTGPDFEWQKKQKYFGCKIPSVAGPENGLEGMKRNYDRVREAREVMGPDAEIMIDCWCGWDRMYTIKMAEMLRELKIKWIEEPMMPDDIEGYKYCRPILNSMGIMLTTGEHEHTRWGAAQLIDNNCVDILQVDTEYCGGISEMKKIIAYASVRDIYVVGHTPTAPAMHVAFNSVSTPFMERIMHLREPMFIGSYYEEDGRLYLKDTPGLGIELNPVWTRIE